MWELVLSKDGRRLGSLELREVRRDRVSGMVSVEVGGQGKQRLATVRAQEADTRALPWRLVFLALEKLYSKGSAQSKLIEDGRCNGIAKSTGKRCKVDALPGRYYCMSHDILSKPPDPPAPQAVVLGEGSRLGWLHERP